MLLIEGLRSLQRPTYLQTPIGGHHHQLRSLDLVGQLTTSDQKYRLATLFGLNAALFLNFTSNPARLHSETGFVNIQTGREQAEA